MFCSECGNEMNSEAGFCSECGNVVKSEGDNISSEENKTLSEGEERVISEEIQNNNDSNSGGGGLRRTGSTILAFLTAVVLPGYLAVSFLASNPGIAIMLLIAIIVLAIVIFKREPKKMAGAIGCIIVLAGVVGGVPARRGKRRLRRSRAG